MSTIFPYIKTKNWQLSTVGVGYIAEGLADIRQCIDILLRTAKGSDPLRPDFGCDIFQYADRPLTVAIPNIIRSIIEAIDIWETRVKLKDITYTISEDNPGQVYFYVTCTLNDEELIDLILLYYGGGLVLVDTTDTRSLTLFAYYPPNPANKRYRISLTLNGSAALPAIPASGFGTIQQMYNWVVANWGIYGRWQMAADRLILVANPNYTSGSLAISLTGVNRFFAVIPLLQLGEAFELSFNADSLPGSPAPPASFATMGDMLQWVQDNWGSYGAWSIEANPATGGDFDLSDFDLSDFDTGSQAIYLLVLETETVNNAAIIVTAV